MLREQQSHPIFRTPLAVDFDETIEVPTPDAWSGKVETDSVNILPIVSRIAGDYRDGWCTYTYEHMQAPELEIICGGINAKTPKASAIWRQGYLTHFGFEQTPEDMNANGRAMLVNTICYAAKLAEDRPIIRRSADARILDRGSIDRLIKNPKRDLSRYLDWYFAPNLRDQLSDMDRKELGEWYAEARHFIRADRRGKFVLDESAKELNIPPDSREFIAATIAAAYGGNADRAATAKELLERYLPSGPHEADTLKAWSTWRQENEDYLFFSDTGGFHWYIDPLAKKLGKSPQDLKGSLRVRRR